MKVTEYLRLYARSTYGFVNIALAVVAGALAAKPLGLLAGFGLGLASAVTVAVLALVSGVGPKAAIAEKERALTNAAKAGLESIKRTSMRLASIRMPDLEVAEAMQQVSLKAAAYASVRARSGSLDPVADNAVEECIELADLYLKELDDQSTERRFGTDDNDPVTEAKNRVLNELKKRAELLDRAALALDGDSSREDLLSIKEQL